MVLLQKLLEKQLLVDGFYAHGATKRLIKFDLSPNMVGPTLTQSKGQPDWARMSQIFGNMRLPVGQTIAPLFFGRLPSRTLPVQN